MKGKISETQSLTSEGSLSIRTLQRDINQMPSSTPSAPPSFHSVSGHLSCPLTFSASLGVCHQKLSAQKLWDAQTSSWNHLCQI